MKFQKITDVQWDVIRKYLPRPARTGRPRADDRKTLDAIMYVCVTGTMWIDHLPERYGSKSTAHKRLQDWQKTGVWKKILAATVRAAHNSNSSSTRWRPYQSTLRVSLPKKGRRHGYDGFRHVAGTKKLHVAAGSAGFPVAVTIDPADRHESTRLIDVMEEDVMGTVPARDCTSEIRKVHADAGYNTETIRRYLRARMIEDCTIPRRRAKKRKKRSDKSNNGKGRCNVVRYVVERFFFSWLKNGFHRLRIRYERRSENYHLAFANIALFMMYFRVLG